MGIGQDNGIPVDNIVSGKVLPWVKENDQYNVWDNWNVNNRDLVFLDKQGNYVSKMNLTSGFDEDYIRNIIECL